MSGTESTQRIGRTTVDSQNSRPAQQMDSQNSDALRSPTDSELTRHMMERHDARDAEIMCRHREFSEGFAECAAELHAFNATGKDIRS